MNYVHEGSKFDDDLLAESFAKIVFETIESYIDKVETLTHKNVPNILSTHDAIMFYFLRPRVVSRFILVMEADKTLFILLVPV